MVSITLTKSAFILSALFSFQVNAGASGAGTTTRYWDCCKPSCAWSGKAAVTAPVGTCSISDTPLADPNAASGCNGGTSYMCSSQSPWAINSTLAYGYAAVNIAGGSESSWCSACYALKFTSGPVIGKTLIVQATNTGGDLGSNQFDLAIPGGGVGIFNGCTAEWGAPSGGWGQQYGGVADRSVCATLPAALQEGCDWRFDWFMGADNPTVDFEQVQCPVEIVAKTGSLRSDDSDMPAVIVGPSAGTSSVASVVASTKSTSTVSSLTTVVKPSSSSKATKSTTSSSLTTVVKPSSSSKATKSTTSSSLTTVAKAVSSSSSCSVATPPASAVAKWGQCGGKGYSGSTTCVSGSTCQYQNDWYSQCL